MLILICTMNIGDVRRGMAQSQENLPPLNSLRAEEDYSYLQSASELSLEESLKYLEIDANGLVYASVGGQYRTRWEHFTNDNWTDEVDQYYSQRLNLHVSLHLGASLRFFGEVYHGLSSNGDRLFQDDKVDLHQGFVEWTPVGSDQHSLMLRVGRQELNLGASRLIGIRDGPNIRRSFDLGKFTYQNERVTFTLLGGTEVNPQFDAFDNTSTLFEELADSNPRIWAAYAEVSGHGGNRVFEVYYIGFQSDNSAFSDVVGQETRHTMGIRSSGKLGGSFSYNTELISQLGRISGNTIRAFNVEADWKFTFTAPAVKPTIGLKLDWSSGDRTLDDGTVNTFNPLFVNPGIYSLAGVNTPANLTSIHPSFTFFPAEGVTMFFEYAVFYRTQRTDGFYSPPRFQTRSADQGRARHIGDVIGLRLAWQANRNVSLTLLSSYFIAGSFINESGPSNNIFYVTPTIDFKF